MNIRVLLRYLIGDRAAILTVAGSRHALWLGFLFVLSAGFAREYDGEDLLHEPWYVVIPLGVSLVASLVLFTLAFGIAKLHGTAAWNDFGSGYRSFLGLFWLTAPLAWLYAVPYEQFLSPKDAMAANLLTLGLVAAWRVALMVRVLMVLGGFPAWRAACIVLCYGTAVALLVSIYSPVPLIDVMGGLRLSERDRLLRSVTANVLCLSFLGFWVTLLGTVLPIARGRPTRPWNARPDRAAGVGYLPWLAAAALAVWPFVLPFTQPAQVNRRALERLFAQRRFDDGLAELSRHEPSDYPPGWVPPPRFFQIYVMTDDIVSVLEAIARTQPADWVREAYLRRFETALARPEFMSDESRARIAHALHRIPGGPELVNRLPPDDSRDNSNQLRKAMERIDAEK